MPVGNPPKVAPPMHAQLEQVRMDAFDRRYRAILEQAVIPDLGRYRGLKVKDAAKLDALSDLFDNIKKDWCGAQFSERRFTFVMNNPDFVLLCVRFSFAARDALMLHDDKETAEKTVLWKQIRQIVKQAGFN